MTKFWSAIIIWAIGFYAKWTYSTTHFFPIHKLIAKKSDLVNFPHTVFAKFFSKSSISAKALGGIFIIFFWENVINFLQKCYSKLGFLNLVPKFIQYQPSGYLPFPTFPRDTQKFYKVFVSKFCTFCYFSIIISKKKTGLKRKQNW